MSSRGCVNSHDLLSAEGPIAPAIAKRAASHDVDLIVMTTHGWGGFKRFWLGS